MSSAPSRPPVARFVVAVGSGKGGVGKSTVSLNLALALAERDSRVGLLDADVYGPNIPLMVGLVRERWGGDWTIARRGRDASVPPIERYGLKIMSVGFLIGDDQPLADTGMARLLITQLMWHTEWGDLDYLVVDLPPGTGAVQEVFLSATAFSGALLVVTPQAVAHQDARKALQMYRAARVPVLGAIENMSGFACPDCGRRIELFPRVPDERSLWAAGVERLGEIPLDPVVSSAGDTGRPLLVAWSDSTQASAFRQIASAVVDRLPG